MNYYTMLEQMMADFPKPSMPLRAESREEYEAWASEARRKLAELLGMDKMKRCDPEPEYLGVTRVDGYRREKWIIQTEPGIRMPFYILIPDDLKPGEKRPLVLCPHGHCGNKDAIAGIVEFPEMAETIRENNYDYGVQIVRRGYIAVCPDARGFGERRESDMQGDEPEKQLGWSCHWLNHMVIPLGRCVPGMWAWDLMRLLDWMLTREYVNPQKIATIGLSGGGLQNMYFSALDQRIGFTVLSGYFYGVKESQLEMHNCSCNYIPGLWSCFDVGEMGAMIAPRSLVIETGDEDPLNGKSGLNNVLPYVDQVRKVFALYHREDEFRHDIFHGHHMWHGVTSFEMLDRYANA